MFASFPTQDHHVVYICSDVIFQILPLCSRPMTSHHVTCHMTAVSHASSLSKRKIKEKKNKIVSVQAFHNSGNTSCIFTRELNREPQQYSTDYLYKVLMVHAMTSLCLS